MFSFASVILAATGAGVLFLMSQPKSRKERLIQQTLGTGLFAIGLAGFIAVVVFKGTLIG